MNSLNRFRTFCICQALGSPALVAALSAIFVTGAQAQDTILHNFTGTASDGSQPYGSLQLLNGTFYGMTSGGGSGGGDGTVFNMNAAGGNFNLLHSFNGFDGAFPQDSLTLDTPSGVGFVAMTLGDNTNTEGTIFSINSSGNISLRHTFDGSATNGGRPFGSLIWDGFSTVYGMTSSGGSSNDGAVFTMNLSGAGFQLLHSFTGSGNNDGMAPQGSLTRSGATLYGMTEYGGSSNEGTIFTVSTSGGSYSVLHNFTGGAGDGNQPFGSLTLIGSTLYGMTEQGGSSGKGTLFSMNANGNNFTVLHTFTGSTTDGAFPLGSLTLIGSTFYGTTENGGSANDGVVFSINTSGSGFTVLNSFTGGTSDGANPQGDLTASGDNKTLYGMTLNGGTAGDGTIFAVQDVVPEPVGAALCAFGALLLAARRRR